MIADSLYEIEASVSILPGEVVVDDDGVVVVPADVAQEVIRRTTEKVTLENHTRDGLMKGAYLKDVYEKCGVL